MDLDVQELNRTFLVKAREIAMTQGDHKANIVMGVSMEMAAFLRRISLSQLNALAVSEVSLFSVRIPVSLFRQIESTTSAEGVDQFGNCQIISGALMGGRQ